MLNKEQDDALATIASFLLSEEPAIIVDGSGGTGKSFLIGALYRELLDSYKQLCGIMGVKPIYNIVRITTTTNKACESLSVFVQSDVSTIHSFLNLRVTEDFKTGKEYLATTNNTHVRYDEVIIIDEASMINRELFKYINQLCSKCKIIYVGDKYQLAPVKEAISEVYSQGYREIKLTQLMRQQNPILADLTNKCKQAVDTHNISIELDNNFIRKLDKQETFTFLNNNFLSSQHNNKICCYTNSSCIQYNNYIHTNVRKYNTPFYVGQRLIANNVLHSQDNRVLLHVEDAVDITQIMGNTTLEIQGNKRTVKIAVINAIGRCLHTCNEIPLILPVNNMDIRSALKIFAKDTDWVSYYSVKKFVADLRYADACTVHKAQGATVDNVLIDLDDLSTCTQTDMFFRLLYVACTRARNNVYFYGTLAKRFGEIICP